MFPQPTSKPESRPDGPPLDSIRLLEQQILAGFPPDLALDLVLNELVVRAAEATRAGAAALALARGNETEMVCRAATGHLAPDLGVPINTRDGLSGACLQTRQPQLSVDTEFDPRIDPAVSRHLGIRSILIVPVFEADNSARFAGVLEIFSTSPAAFSHNDQVVLEGFAEECARIRQSASELGHREIKQRNSTQVKSTHAVPPELLSSESDPPGFSPPASPTAKYRTYEAWTLVLGALAIVAIIAFSLLIGSRIGWLRPTASSPQAAKPPKSCLGIAAPGCPAEPSLATTNPSHRANPSQGKKVSEKAKASMQTSPTLAPASDELVVYEKGKVIFRMKPATAKPNSGKGIASKPGSTKANKDKNSVIEASSTTKIAASQSLWLSPEQAETRLLGRVEPEYPAEALAAHRTGNVILEVQVAEDGSVSNIRTLSGDPILATAATEAVRNWRYQPYRQHDHASQFQTDVTLGFKLPN
jgi:TonB family protein